MLIDIFRYQLNYSRYNKINIITNTWHLATQNFTKKKQTDTK